MTMRPQTTKSIKTIYVAMSGGVDSSVASALLKQQGYHVVGVFFKPWQPDNGPAYCNWQQDHQDAVEVAARLGIELKTWDFSKEYGTEVTQYMIQAYRQGLTPNPDIMCNQKIKFGLFLDRALAEGADLIATGHYARVKYNKRTKTYQLLKAEDTNKDQTYFLSTLNQAQLSKSLFPIGDYTKPKVREIAKKLELITYNKKDSQGVCFVGQLSMKDFLSKYIKPESGNVILAETGETIGHHDGVYYYTIGQRHGLDLSKDGGPYYVVSKDTTTNTIYVTKDKKTLATREIVVDNLSWTEAIPTLPMTAKVKIRYRGQPVSATLTAVDGNPNRLQITTKKTLQAVAKGQSAVFYKGRRLIGSGIIV